ncbi:MAG TPA: tripartite tricarboxylate transporter substrate binding protein [Pseudorhodoferax sp.]|nr:tripartite tricarboxylate transporter substrate binding protein [Pseudorhodoferax sp.]
MPMTRRCMAQAMVLGAAGLSALDARAAKGFPDKPIRMILPFSPGGGTDESSRSYADELHKLLGVPIVAENRPGASGLIAVNALLSAPPDGYTLLVATNSLASVNPVLRKDLPYDAFKDLQPIHGLVNSAPVISAPLATRATPLRQMLLRAKKEGRPLSIGNYSEGYQLLAAWIGTLEQVPVIHVPYKGPSPMLVDLVGGRLDLAISDPTSAMELVRGGKLRGVATGGAERERQMPEVPTMVELGYPEFETYVWSSIFVRSGTPADIAKTLADAVASALVAPAVQERNANRPGTPMMLALGALGDFQRREYERFRKVADAAGMAPR